MIAKALDSGWAEIVYEDDEARILKIRTVKGEPADATKDDPPETEEEKKILDEEDKKAGVNKAVIDDEENDNQ